MTDTKRIIFSEREKEILINLISPRIQVLESKKERHSVSKQKTKRMEQTNRSQQQQCRSEACEPKQLQNAG